MYSYDDSDGRFTMTYNDGEITLTKSDGGSISLTSNTTKYNFFNKIEVTPQSSSFEFVGIG